MKQQMDNLTKVIDKRVMAILLPGPSITELEEKIGQLEELDICYTSVNDFWIMEERILSKIDKNLDIVMCSSKECNVPSGRHTQFLDRDDYNLFVTEEMSFHHSLGEYKKKYADKLFFFNADRTGNALAQPSMEHPLNFLAQCSFSILLCLGIIGGAKAIVLFGADGGRPSGTGSLYYGGWSSQSESRLSFDTITFNNTMPIILRNLYTRYSVPAVRVVNCSLHSKYEVFIKQTYNGVIKWLRRIHGYDT